MTAWEKINREEQQRDERMAIQAGWTFIGLAIIGSLVGLIMGRAGMVITSVVVNLLIGVPLLLLGTRARRKRSGIGQ